MKEAVTSLNKLINEEWEYRLKEYPIFATRAGDHRYDDKLEKKSEKDYDRRLVEILRFRYRLSDIPIDELPDSDKLNYKIFDIVLQRYLKTIEYKTYRMPLSKTNGFHLTLPELQAFMPFNTIQDYNNYIERLKAIPVFIDDNIEIMKKGIQSGHMPPQVTLEGVVDAFDKHTNNPDENRFFLPFTNLSDKFTSQEKDELVTKARLAISGYVIPSYKKMSEFLTSEYIPQTREDISAVNLPNGEEYYQYCIWHYTSLNLTAKEVHEIGLSEVRKIKNEMERLLKKINFKGTIKDFIAFLRMDPQFYVDSPEELLEKTALVNKRMDGQLPSLFKTLPRLPYGIKAIPDYAAPGNYTAYYQPGTGDGTKAGTYYVNTYNVKSRPLYEIEALSFHESVPGHHLQIAIQLELDLPPFRKHSDFTSFVEGWALYTEQLGLETNPPFYQSPYSNFGRLSYDMWRACRLVVDTGMHTMGWSRQQAIDFMTENSSLSLLNIRNEVDRYISWPGQALAYKLGQLKIRELRKKAEEELKEKFDIRLFHDAVLENGSIPLSILEDKMNEFIQKTMQLN